MVFSNSAVNVDKRLTFEPLTVNVCGVIKPGTNYTEFVEFTGPVLDSNELHVTTLQYQITF